jgi:dihydroneopterin aldolase/2-amino-4-hydroxy-6-hydroxymethyldihydropteridine diphosphokinase
VREVEITVHKPHAPVAQIVADITVTISRSRAVAASGDRMVVLALGSNLGDRLANLQQAVDLLCGRDFRCTAVSGVYQTAPVGGPPQDDYLNAVLVGRSDRPAVRLLGLSQAAEAARHRVRAERWGPRTLDVDVIAVGDEISADPALTLPHPRAHERAFVLVPWLEADPEAVLPGHGRVADLVAATGTAGVRRLEGAVLTLPEEAR